MSVCPVVPLSTEGTGAGGKASVIYRCEWEGCSYSTEYSSHMGVHMRIHTGEKVRDTIPPSEKTRPSQLQPAPLPPSVLTVGLCADLSHTTARCVAGPAPALHVRRGGLRLHVRGYLLTASAQTHPHGREALPL
jgi:hypothetical protein